MARLARAAAVLSGAALLAACGSPGAPPTAARPSPTPSASETPAPGLAPTQAPAASPPAPALVPVPPLPPVASSGWVGPIYAPGAHGYDVSYPQCQAVQAPAGAAFSVIGVNGGRAFTVNPCLAAQWRSGRGPRAVYFNSGYNADNAARTTPDCRSRAELQDPSADVRSAYAIGCSEAEYSVAAMRAAGATGAVMIWVDVESSNSWDSGRVDLNRRALQAELDQLAASGRLVGLYGTFAEWQEIVGSWSPGGVVANWVAGQPPDTACRAPGFSGQPVWLVQELSAWPGGDDSDRAC